MAYGYHQLQGVDAESYLVCCVRNTNWLAQKRIPIMRQRLEEFDDQDLLLETAVPKTGWTAESHIRRLAHWTHNSGKPSVIMLILHTSFHFVPLHTRLIVWPLPYGEMKLLTSYWRLTSSWIQ